MLSHSEMDDFYELYVLGVLESEERIQVERHLSDGCEYCHASVERARVVAAALSELAPFKTAPPELRQRILDTVRASRKAPTVMTPLKPKRTGLFFLASALAAAVLIAVALGYQVRQLSTQVETIRAQREELRAALQSLSRGDTRTAQFGKPNQPTGQVFVGRNNGVVLVASKLPPLPAGRSFELWLIPKSGAPTPAGLFRANAQGDSVQISTQSIGTDTAAIAVSVEPEGGSPAPSTTPIIIAPLGG